MELEKFDPVCAAVLKKTEIVYGRNDGVLHKTPSFRL